jgi:hypothetical protein
MAARSRTIFEVALTVIIVSLMGAYAVVARRGARGSDARKTCLNNLRQIGAATIQYADDHRFAPHFTSYAKLDPGHTSDTATRAMEALASKGYLPDPKVFVCPASPDRPPERAPVRAVLTASTDLSYGWARRGLATNTRSLQYVAGDKARFIGDQLDEPARAGNMRGNHDDCMYVATIDGSTQKIPVEGDLTTTFNIANTTYPGGYLGVLQDGP